MKVVIDISEHYYEILKYDVEHGNGYKPIVLIANGTPLKTCGTCGFNHGIMTNTEFNPEDIVCEYWESDGLTKDDFCSRWKDKESEDANSN